MKGELLMEKIIAKIKEERPLVHHITNNVTVNDSANITLYWGGLPVMAYAKEEVAEMVEAASALVLNIGTLTADSVEAMLIAGKEANKLGIPIIFDPVGVGATTFRTEVALKILRELDIAVIKGNQGEISILAGQQGEVKGVEAVGEYKNIAETAQKLAKGQKAVVVVSGVKDIISDGDKVYQVSNGNNLMGQVVGTGCMLGSTLGVFCGVSSNYLEATLSAVTAYGIAGEKASKKATQPASYKVAFLDSISELSDEDLAREQQVEQVM